MKIVDISVIIPVYNVEKYLKRCIESVLLQTGINYEIILVDDGSSDRSSEICDQYAENYDIIHVIHKKNEGLGYARNSGIDIARGKYVFFLDSDDWIVADALWQLLEKAEKNKADLVCFQYVMTQKENIKIANVNSEGDIVVDNKELMYRYITGLSSTACTKLYRRELFQNVRFSKVPIHEDAYSMHLILKNVDIAVISNQVYYVQYIRKGSLTQTKFQEKNMLCIECGDRLIQFVQEEYPEFITEAYIHKIERQIYTIRLIINSFKILSERQRYFKIVSDIKIELDLVNKKHGKFQNILQTATFITHHPILFVISSGIKNIGNILVMNIYRRIS